MHLINAPPVCFAPHRAYAALPVRDRSPLIARSGYRSCPVLRRHLITIHGLSIFGSQEQGHSRTAISGRFIDGRLS